VKADVDPFSLCKERGDEQDKDSDPGLDEGIETKGAGG